MWKITFNHLEKKPFVRQSRNWDQVMWDAMPDSQKTKIKLYDDDHNLYYDGVTSDIDEDEDLAFAPLDWAAGYAGCTYMKYKCPETGAWKTL
jgi:hypothetical protein